MTAMQAGARAAQTEGMADIAVIGGGMVGISIALHCLERGLRVTLLDGGSASARASYGNAGAISRGSIFPVASPSVMKGLLRYAANRDPGLRIDYANAWRIWPWINHFLRSANEAAWRTAARWLDPFVAGAFDAHVKLAAASGSGHLISRDGWIKLFRTPEAFAASQLERLILSEYAIRVEMLDSAAIRALEPGLKRTFAAGMLFPETGHVSDPGALLASYEALFLAKGGRIIRRNVTDLRSDENGWAIMAGEAISARMAVIAAGSWSDGIVRRLGYHFPMAAERGYHVHFAPAAELKRTIYDSAAGYVAAPTAQGTRILSGIELAPRDAKPDRRQINRCIDEARTVLNLGGQIEDKAWCGSRPSTPDGLPIIGRAPRHAGLFLAFGHGHIGLSTGPVTGRIVADIATGRAPHIAIDGFSPGRFL